MTQHSPEPREREAIPGFEAGKESDGTILDQNDPISTRLYHGPSVKLEAGPPLSQAQLDAVIHAGMDYSRKCLEEESETISPGPPPRVNCPECGQIGFLSSSGPLRCTAYAGEKTAWPHPPDYAYNCPECKQPGLPSTGPDNCCTACANRKRLL